MLLFPGFRSWFFRCPTIPDRPEKIPGISLDQPKVAVWIFTYKERKALFWTCFRVFRANQGQICRPSISNVKRKSRIDGLLSGFPSPPATPSSDLLKPSSRVPARWPIGPAKQNLPHTQDPAPREAPQKLSWRTPGFTAPSCRNAPSVSGFGWSWPLR